MANLYYMTSSELEEMARKNSAVWAGADAATRDALHAQNQEIRQILDGRNGTTSTFNSGTGTWSTAQTSRAPTVVQQGSGGVAANGYSGRANATTPDGRSIVVTYANGVMQDQDTVPDGTIVHAANGQDYRYTKSEAQKNSDLLAQYQKLYNGDQSPYAQILAQQKAAQQAATDRAVNALNAQKGTTADQYAQYYRQAYLDKMAAQKNLDQKLTMQGITGGAAETTRLGYDTAYGDAVRQLMQSEAAQQAALDQAITDARLTGDYEAANAAANAIKEQTDSYANTLQNLINRNDTLTARQTAYDREDALRAEQYAREDALLAAEREREDAATARTWAQNQVWQALQNGNIPDDELLAEAGMTRATAQLLLRKLQGTGGSYSGGSYSGRTSYSQATAEMALRALLNGSDNDATRAIVESYYKMPVASVLAAYGYGGQTPTSTNYGASFESGSGYDRTLANIQQLRADGYDDTTIRNVISSARQSGDINAEQAARLLSSFTTVRGAR